MITFICGSASMRRGVQYTAARWCSLLHATRKSTDDATLLERCPSFFVLSVFQPLQLAYSKIKCICSSNTDVSNSGADNDAQSMSLSQVQSNNRLGVTYLKKCYLEKRMKQEYGLLELRYCMGRRSLVVKTLGSHPSGAGFDSRRRSPRLT